MQEIALNSGVKLESAWIETITAWQEGRGAYIAEYATGLNGDELVRLRLYGPDLKIVKVNADHAIAKAVENYFMESDLFAFMVQGLPVHERNSIIPEPDKPFVVYRDKPTSQEVEFSGEEEFWSMIGQALTGPLAVLLRELRGIRYLGPIREIPPRTYRAPKTPMESCWASGLGAWDALIRDSDLVEQTSHYLQDVLKLGYSIHHRELLSIDAKGEIMAALRRLAAQDEDKDTSHLRTMVLDPLERLPRQPAIQLHDEVSDIDVDPSDIGVGVSQVIPVVVGALDAGPSENPCRIFAVEQPELHVHPAVQAALGDVFVDAVNGTERAMLIETHSEHLILRLLRRVREGTDGTITSPALRLTPDMLSIVYVKRKKGGIEITPLPITEEGEFTRHWPDGFFEERAEELF